MLARRGRRGTEIRDQITSFQDRLQGGSLAPPRRQRSRSKATITVDPTEREAEGEDLGSERGELRSRG